MEFANRRVVCFMTARYNDLFERSFPAIAAAAGPLFARQRYMIQSSLTDFMVGKVVFQANLGHVMDFLACALDANDDNPGLLSKDVAAACNFAFESLNNFGAFEPSGVPENSHFSAVSAF